MKSLIIGAMMLLAGVSISITGYSSSVVSIDDFACTYTTKDGSISVTAETCAKAKAGLLAALAAIK